MRVSCKAGIFANEGIYGWHDIGRGAVGIEPTSEAIAAAEVRA